MICVCVYVTSSRTTARTFEGEYLRSQIRQRTLPILRYFVNFAPIHIIYTSTECNAETTASPLGQTEVLLPKRQIV